MKEQRADLFFFYHSKREAVERLAYYACFGFVLIAALSRSVVQKQSNDGSSEEWDYILGGVDNSYLVIFGPLVIFAVAAWFNRQFLNCLECRKSLVATVEEGQLGESTLNSLEVTLTKPPFFCGDKCYGWFKSVLPRLVFIVGFICVFSLVWEYGTFRPDDLTDAEKKPWRSWYYPWIGEGYLQGFEPEWPRYKGKSMPWIYPPFYPIVYLAIFFLLGQQGLESADGVSAKGR